MKIRLQPAFAFEPKRWAAENVLSSDEDKLRQLRAENPQLARGLEVLQVGSSMGLQYAGGPGGTRAAPPWNKWYAPNRAFGALSGVVAAGTAAWGINKLVQGQTTLDYVEGVGQLAFAADLGLGARAAFGAGAPGPVQNALGAVYATSDLVLGGNDLKRGLKEKDKHRAIHGGLQCAMGASMMASVFVPSASHLANAVWVGAIVARQINLGGTG